MKKQIISTALAAVFAIAPLTALAGEYYGDMPLPDIYYSDIDGSPISETDFDAAMTAAEKAGAKHDEKAFADALKTLRALDDQEYLSMNIASLNSSKHNTPENNAAETAIRKNYINHYERETALVRAYADDASLRPLLIDWRGEKDFNDMAGDMYTERYFELAAQEQELVEEYRNNPVMDIPYTDADGNVYTLRSLNSEYADKLLSLLPSDEMNKITNTVSSILTVIIEKESDIFLRMVKVRNEMAREAGYDNFYDYVSETVYQRDYSSGEMQSFRNAVKEYILPVSYYIDPWPYDSIIDSMTNDEIVSLVGRGMEKLAPELGETFDYMTSRGFLDVCENEDRLTPGNAFTMPLGNMPAASIFISTIEGDPDSTYSTLVHEFGHYNSMLRYNIDTIAKTGKPILEGDITVDIQEIYSQGLELLFSKLYPEMMTLRGSAAKQADRIHSMMYSIRSGCLFDEWQQEVYSAPDLTAEALTRRYYEIAQSYGVDLISTPWYFVEHNFTSPVYYFGYAVSAAAALDIWAQSQTDYDGALDRYMKLTTKEEKNFRSLLTENGFDNIFEADTIKKIADSIYGFYTAGYEDITLDDWYITDIRLTKPFFDNAGDEAHFRPHEPMTRLETANTLGKLNEYATSVTYTGTSTFNDASTTYAAWAADTGVIKGYDAHTLGAADTLTREQAVTMLYRYAKHEALELYADEDNGAAGYLDTETISDWANEAFDWAIASGIIYGIPTEEGQILAPQLTLTRSQFAAMAARLITFSEMRLGKG